MRIGKREKESLCPKKLAVESLHEGIFTTIFANPNVDQWVFANPNVDH
jgi:hypothetical protein